MPSVSEVTNRFPRVRRGYDPAAVEEFLNGIESANEDLRGQAEALRTELAVVQDTLAGTATEQKTSTPAAMTDRIAKMLRSAVDEVSTMQTEVRVEARAAIASAAEAAAAADASSRQILADIESRRRSLEMEYAAVVQKAREEAARITADAVSECEEMRQSAVLRSEQARDDLQAELAQICREADAQIEEQIRVTARECEKRLLDAKNEAERISRVADERIGRVREARHSLEAIAQKRVWVLGELMQVHGSLEVIPAVLDTARREMNISPDSGLVLSNELEAEPSSQ